MSKKVRLYLIGDENSKKTNSWLAMTNNEETAEVLMKEIEGASTIKMLEFDDWLEAEE